MRVLYNAHILPPEFNGVSNSALAIQNGRIVDVGDEASILSRYGLYSEIQDMHGQIVWPGLVDAHIHLEQYALSLSYVDCETTSRQECLERVRERASIAAPGEWIIGHGWNQNDWSEGFGNYATLDDAAPHNPVFLTSKSLHSAWINSLAMQQSRISPETSNPDGGVIQRNSEGNPTGILLENAVELCINVIPQPDVSKIIDMLQMAQANLLSMGVTGVHDFDGSRCFSALQSLQTQGNLHLRVVKSIQGDEIQSAINLGIRSGFGNDLLRMGPVKFFADGALGQQTAAMILPYENEDTNLGLLFLDSQKVFEYGKEAVFNGLSLAIHAIGDRANHEVLEGYAKIQAWAEENHLQVLRNRVEHVQIIDPDDLHHFANRKVIASMQPVHAISDMMMADRYWGDRSGHAYAWQELVQKNAVLAFGSDAPVESPNPFLGLYAATTRRRLDGYPGGEGWHQEQKITLQEAIKAYTFGPAFATSSEDQVGRLAPGYFADLIVLDVDPFHVSIDDLQHMKPIATMVNGEWVWEKEK